jgi:hypothetical protein
MTTFNPALLKSKIVYAHRCTTALGGSFVYSNTPTGKLYKVDIPSHLARGYVRSAGRTTRYKDLIPTCVATYNNDIVSLELFDGRQNWDKKEIDEWTPKTNLFIQHINKLNKWAGWEFDGRYVYTFGVSPDVAVGIASEITSDQRFRTVPVKAIDLSKASFYTVPDKQGELEITSTREVLAFVTNEGDYATTTPAWRSLQAFAKEAIYATGDVDTVEDAVKRMVTFVQLEEGNKNRYWLDSLNDNFSVNLNFVLYAGPRIAKMYGYDAADALCFPELILDNRTVNLHQIPHAVSHTKPVGISVVQALAWLMGFINRETDKARVAEVQKIIKYLFARGVFQESTVKSVFKVDDIKSVNDIPRLVL